MEDFFCQMKIGNVLGNVHHWARCGCVAASSYAWCKVYIPAGNSGTSKSDFCKKYGTVPGKEKTN